VDDTMSDVQQNGEDGLWIVNDEAHTLFVNERMAEILGTTQTELVQQNSFDYIYPEDLPAAERLFRLKIGGSRAPFRFKLRRKDGIPVLVQVQATPMFNAEGRFTGIVGTFTVADGET
jgi:PAS domain S-box-containing protein